MDALLKEVDILTAKGPTAKDLEKIKKSTDFRLSGRSANESFLDKRAEKCRLSQKRGE